MATINHVCLNHENVSPTHGISRIDSLGPVASSPLTEVPRTSPHVELERWRQGDNAFIAKFHTDDWRISWSISCVSWQPSCSSKFASVPLVRRIKDPCVVEECETPLVGQQDVPPQRSPFTSNLSCPNDDPRPAFNHYLRCPFNNSSTPVHNFNSRSMR